MVKLKPCKITVATDLPDLHLNLRFNNKKCLKHERSQWARMANLLKVLPSQSVLSSLYLNTLARKIQAGRSQSQSLNSAIKEAI